MIFFGVFSLGVYTAHELMTTGNRMCALGVEFYFPLGYSTTFWVVVESDGQQVTICVTEPNKRHRFQVHADGSIRYLGYILSGSDGPVVHPPFWRYPYAHASVVPHLEEAVAFCAGKREERPSGNREFTTLYGATVSLHYKL